MLHQNLAICAAMYAICTLRRPETGPTMRATPRVVETRGATCQRNPKEAALTDKIPIMNPAAVASWATHRRNAK